MQRIPITVHTRAKPLRWVRASMSTCSLTVLRAALRNIPGSQSLAALPEACHDQPRQPPHNASHEVASLLSSALTLLHASNLITASSVSLPVLVPCWDLLQRPCTSDTQQVPRLCLLRVWRFQHSSQEKWFCNTRGLPLNSFM